MCNTRLVLKFQFNEAKTVPMREIFFGGCCKYSGNYIYFFLEYFPNVPFKVKDVILNSRLGSDHIEV